MQHARAAVRAFPAEGDLAIFTVEAGAVIQEPGDCALARFNKGASGICVGEPTLGIAGIALAEGTLGNQRHARWRRKAEGEAETGDAGADDKDIRGWGVQVVKSWMQFTGSVDGMVSGGVQMQCEAGTRLGSELVYH